MCSQGTSDINVGSLPNCMIWSVFMIYKVIWTPTIMYIYLEYLGSWHYKSIYFVHNSKETKTL